MTITTAICNSAKLEIMQGDHDFDADTFKLCLIRTSPTGTYGQDTTNYSDIVGNGDEVSGAGYTAGGVVMTDMSLSLDGSVAIVDWADPEWPESAFSVRGCMIYNASKGNRALAVYDFGADITIVNGTFIARMPMPNAANAVFRLS